MARKRKSKSGVTAEDLKPGYRFYFAYGSNMSIAAMRRRCPSAIPVKSLWLPGARLVFRLVADIEITHDPADRVPGALWQINAADEAVLDTFEGASRKQPSAGLYRRMTFTIGNRKWSNLKCLVYKMNRSGVLPPV